MCGQFGLFGCIPFTFSPLSSPGHQTLWHVTCSISRYLYYHQHLNIIYNCQHLGKSLLSHITNVVSIVVLLTEKAKRLLQRHRLPLSTQYGFGCVFKDYMYDIWCMGWPIMKWKNNFNIFNHNFVHSCNGGGIEDWMHPTKVKSRHSDTFFLRSRRKCVSTELSYGKYVRMVRNHNIWYVWYTYIVYTYIVFIYVSLWKNIYLL